MVSHEHKVIFIHIPKCGGTSVEHLFNVHPFNNKISNYTNVVGWCPKRKIFMQHATAKQLLELDLVKPEIWEEYLKFSIVRNPWARALSGYEWLKKKLKVVDSFKNYLYREGKFASALTKSGEINYRGDHLLPQYEYLQIDNKFVVDHIYRLEEINDDIKKIFDDCNINVEKLPVKNVGKYKYKHYSHFYNNTRSDLVRRYYIKDIELFKYSFENKKNEMNYLDQINNMFKHYDLKNRIKYILRYKRVNI